jgi:hypothetical protein
MNYLLVTKKGGRQIGAWFMLYLDIRIGSLEIIKKKFGFMEIFDLNLK